MNQNFIIVQYHPDGSIVEFYRTGNLLEAIEQLQKICLEHSNIKLVLELEA